MNNFEQSAFTYEDLEQGGRFFDSEQSIASGVTISSEGMSDDAQIEQRAVCRGLEDSGVFIEPFEQFYSDGAAPELSAR